jgi:hypothetical protein
VSHRQCCIICKKGRLPTSPILFVGIANDPSHGATSPTLARKKKLMQCDDTKYCKEMWDQAALGQYQELEA